MGDGEMNENKQTYRNTVDVFDALPVEIQKNHKLLKAFCYWYLDRWEPKQKDRMMVKNIARELALEHPDYKSTQLAALPEIDEIRKSGNYTIDTIKKWIRQAVKIPSGRPKRRS